MWMDTFVDAKELELPFGKKTSAGLIRKACATDSSQGGQQGRRDQVCCRRKPERLDRARRAAPPDSHGQGPGYRNHHRRPREVACSGARNDDLPTPGRPSDGVEGSDDTCKASVSDAGRWCSPMTRFIAATCRSPRSSAPGVSIVRRRSKWVSSLTKRISNPSRCPMRPAGHTYCTSGAG